MGQSVVKRFDLLTFANALHFGHRHPTATAMIDSAIATSDRWSARCLRLNMAADQGVYRQLIKAWSARARHYHALAHLEACLVELDSVRSAAIRVAEIEMALWFHDAIYKTYSKTNEERSAEWARLFLVKAGASSDVAQRVQRYVLATRHTADGLSGDAALTVDIDLSILGMPRDAYDAFERNVRKEYWWVSHQRYVHGRAAILQSFLDRPFIYGTPVMRERYENAARDNIKRAIAELA